MTNKEIRAGIPVEVRAEDSEIRVSGYAAVFDTETNIGGMFTEQIARGAFSEAIGRDDVVFLINHEGLPLARTSSGTLTLSEDKRGLKMEARLSANDPDVQRIKTKMERGDLDKMSFAFYPEVEEWDDSGDLPARTIKQARLDDVSIVTRPAYDTTEIGLRSLEEARSKKKEHGANSRNARLRRRLKMRTDLAEREGRKAASQQPQKKETQK